MSSEGADQASAPRSNPCSSWFDDESAAVVTIMFGLFQVVLSVPLAYSSLILPNMFILPLAIGILVISSGSATMANARNPSRQLLKGCACTNVIGLLGALVAFCLYCANLVTINHREPCDLMTGLHHYHRRHSYNCPEDILAAYCWILTLLLLIHDCGAIIVQSFLSASAIKALKTD